jgi:hypothetical protein
MAARTSNGRESLLASVTIERHYTAIPAYGFANIQVRRILLARADENTPERFVVDAAELEIVLQVSANRNRKGGPKAAGWLLAANRFPEMRIGKHMGSGNRDFAAVLMRSGLHPADARRVTKIRPRSRRRQCVGRACFRA